MMNSEELAREIKVVKQKYTRANSRDERIQHLLILSNPFKNSNYEEALAFALQGISLTNEYESLIQFKIHEIYGLTFLSRLDDGYKKCDELYLLLKPDDLLNKLKTFDYSLTILLRQSDFEAVIACEKQLNAFQPNTPKEHTLMGSIIMNIGIAYYSTGKVELAITSFLEAKTRFEEAQNFNGIIQITYNIAHLYFLYEDLEIAYKYINEALALVLEHEPYNDKMISMAHEVLSNIHIKKGEKKLANKHYRIAIKYAKKFPIRKNHILINYAGELIKENKLNEFFKIEKEILSRVDLLKKEKQYALSFYCTAAKAYLLAQDISTTEAYLSKALEMPENQLDIDIQLDILDLQIEMGILKEDFKHVVKIQKEYHELYKNKMDATRQKVVQELEVKFEMAEKEKKAEAFKTESLKFQLQSLRSQMNPHFVFNAINSIADVMEIATIEKSRKLMASFARLMRSNLEFAEQEKISLEEEITFLNDYLLLEQNRLGKKLQFEINYSEDLALDFIELPSMLIQPYIENSIKHGILPLKEKGLIQVEFKEKNDFLICTVKDNGVGRKQASKKRDKLEKHLGKSTSITATRLTLLSNNEKENVQVVYTDLEDKHGESLGTTVTLKIIL